MVRANTQGNGVPESCAPVVLVKFEHQLEEHFTRKLMAQT